MACLPPNSSGLKAAVNRSTATQAFVDRKGLIRGVEFIGHFRGTNTPTGGFVDGEK